MKVEIRDIESVMPYPGNPRINEGAVDAVATSIREYGWRQAIVVDTQGVVICGHTRLKAAQKLGLAKVPVHVAEGLTEAQVKAYRLADNKSSELAEWDLDMLKVELGDLKALDVDLGSLGFSADDLVRIFGEEASEGLTNPDEVPEAPEEAITKPGDLWILGEHRLLCGDATKTEDVRRLMAGQKAALVSTDPPYLVDYTGERPNDSGKDWSDTYHEIDIKDAEGFFRAVFENMLYTISPHAAIYVWHAHKRVGLIQRLFEELGILDHQQVVWVKPTAVFGRVYWHFRHEPCVMGWVKGSKPEHDGTHEFNSVWEVDWEGQKRVVGNEHPTQKPVELFARPMRKHTKRGDICFEPFSGSGSQIIAGEKLGRRVFAMEIEPKFVDVAIARWETFTGKKAQRNIEEVADAPTP